MENIYFLSNISYHVFHPFSAMDESKTGKVIITNVLIYYKGVNFVSEDVLIWSRKQNISVPINMNVPF